MTLRYQLLYSCGASGQRCDLRYGQGNLVATRNVILVISMSYYHQKISHAIPVAHIHCEYVHKCLKIRLITTRVVSTLCTVGRYVL